MHDSDKIGYKQGFEQLFDVTLVLKPYTKAHFPTLPRTD